MINIVVYDYTREDMANSFQSICDKLRGVSGFKSSRLFGCIKVLDIEIAFRCGNVANLQGIRPNYYLSYSYKASRFLSQSAVSVNGVELQSENNIIDIVKSRLIELEKEKENMRRMNRLGRNVILKTCELVEDKDLYYLHLIYGYEDDYGVYELHIPKMLLPIRKDVIPSVEMSNLDRLYLMDNTAYADFHGQKFELAEGDISCKDLNGDDVHTRARSLICTLLEKKHEMTLEEIEKKLGYKVKIVSEKGK